MAFPLLTSTDQDGTSTLYDDVSLTASPLFSISAHFLSLWSSHRDATMDCMLLCMHTMYVCYYVTPVSEKCPFIGQTFSECHYKYSLGAVPRPLLLRTWEMTFLSRPHHVILPYVHVCGGPRLMGEAFSITLGHTHWGRGSQCIPEFTDVASWASYPAQGLLSPNTRIMAM